MPVTNDPPAPEGWVYITHPEIGRSANPVTRTSLPAWEAAGWKAESARAAKAAKKAAVEATESVSADAVAAPDGAVSKHPEPQPAGGADTSRSATSKTDTKE
jgi:uncharacterized iron-regulated membrane protein